MRMKLLAPVTLMLAGALSSTSYAQDKGACSLEISGNDAIQFDKKSLEVPATCKEVTLTLKHSGKLPKTAMGHNWVLTRSADVQAVSDEGMKAGPTNEYVKPKDARVLAATKVIGGGESTTIKFPTTALKKGEAYMFVCTFPGHSALMRGAFTLK